MSRRRVVRNKGVIADARRRRVPDSGQRLAFQIDPWTRRLVRPLLITLLATAFSVSLLVIVRIATPDLPWMAVVPLLFLVALEGTYTTAWLNNPDSNGVDRVIYRMAEVFLILVIARVYSWIVFGGGIPTPEEMRLFLTQPMTLFSVAGFVTTSLVTLVGWQFAVSTCRLFAKLDVSVYEIGYFTQPVAAQKAQGDDRPIQPPREQLQNQFLNIWLMVGMIMAIIAALSTYEVGQLTSVTNPFEIARLGLSPAMLFALIIYFLAGFWLVSHAWQLRMNARWLTAGFAKEAGVERHWQRNALAVLLVIAFLAAFLPIGSTLAISRILTLGLSGIGYLAGILSSYFGKLISAVFQLVLGDSNQLPEEIVEQPPPPLVDPPIIPPAGNDSLAAMVISSAFWALLIAIIIASFLFFLRERGYRIDRARVQLFFSGLNLWVREMWRKLRGNMRATRRRLSAGLHDAVARVNPQGNDDLLRPRLARLNALSPREQVRFYYLALVRRARERGVKRRESDTPLEFMQDLKHHWPHAEEDLDELTHAFLEARYSPQPIEKTDASFIKQVWNSLKVKLRQSK